MFIFKQLSIHILLFVMMDNWCGLLDEDIGLNGSVLKNVIRRKLIDEISLN